MTINIAVVTTDAVILGCDSIASQTMPMLDPLQIGIRNEDGILVAGTDGRFSGSFGFDDIKWVVNNAWGGVAKLFQIHTDSAHVAAITAGMAKLVNRSVDNIAAEYFALKRGSPIACTKEVAEDFLSHMRSKYEDHYARQENELPEEFRQDLQFIVGGHGHDDTFPSAWRLDVKAHSCSPLYTDGKTGICWGGQADAVERFFHGTDSGLVRHVDQQISETLAKFRESVEGAVVAYLNEKVVAQGRELPPLTLPEVPRVELDWYQSAYQVDCNNLPLQGAIDLVSQLAMMQSLRARHGGGVPTVGGRIRIGVVTKDGFQALNEPQLEHRFTGLGDVI